MGPSTPLCDPLWLLYLDLVRSLLCLLYDSFVGGIQGTDILASLALQALGPYEFKWFFSCFSSSLSLPPPSSGASWVRVSLFCLRLLFLAGQMKPSQVLIARPARRRG